MYQVSGSDSEDRSGVVNGPIQGLYSHLTIFFHTLYAIQRNKTNNQNRDKNLFTTFRGRHDLLSGFVTSFVSRFLRAVTNTGRNRNSGHKGRNNSNRSKKNTGNKSNTAFFTLRAFTLIRKGIDKGNTST